MSEFEPQPSPYEFPAYAEVSKAYAAVIDLNKSLQQPDYTDEAMLNDMFGELSSAAQAALNKLPGEAEDFEYSPELEQLKTLHDHVFAGIGISLQMRIKPDGATNTMGLEGSRYVVPEISSAQQYDTYLNHIGVQGVYHDQVHFKLAQDVIENVDDQIEELEAIRLNLTESEAEDRAGTQEFVIDCRSSYLDTFRTIMPFYYNSHLRWLPAYARLVQRVKSDTNDSL